MSKKIHSQDSSFEAIWKEMEEIEPLTPLTSTKDSLQAYRDAAAIDRYLFGDYDSYEAYKSTES
jgi:hypothetical protein